MTSPVFLQDTFGRPTIQQLALSSRSVLYKHSEWNLMQAELSKQMMREVQAPQRRARQVGLKLITSHHCSLVKELPYES